MKVQVTRGARGADAFNISAGAGGAGKHKEFKVEG